MPIKIARMLAEDDAVGSEELDAAIGYLGDKIRNASLDNAPVPFLAYRNKMIFEATLKIRREGILSREIQGTEA
jgi:hypothetical protein